MLRSLWIALAALSALMTSPAAAAPEPAAHDFTIRDFRFRSGQVLPELRIHYYTLGQPRRDAAGRITNAVLILHGTGGSGRQFLSPQFADVLFAPGGLLDPATHYIILPDGIGHGGSSKPSDGLRMGFPTYDYADMVEAQHALVTRGLGVERLRLLMGTSMGCMHGFMWGEMWPDAAQALMPLACQPVEIAGRNRLWRKLAMDAITTDPAWQGGDYKTQPVQGLRAAQGLLILAGGSPLPMQLAMPTRDEVDAYVARELPRRVAPIDANDFLYQVAASRTYDPSKDLERRMAEAAEAGDLETAGLLRDAIARIRSGESNLREQRPGKMGLGSSQERYAPDPKRPLPKKPDPMTAGHKPGGRRRG